MTIGQVPGSYSTGPLGAVLEQPAKKALLAICPFTVEPADLRPDSYIIIGSGLNLLRLRNTLIEREAQAWILDYPVTETDVANLPQPAKLQWFRQWVDLKLITFTGTTVKPAELHKLLTAAANLRGTGKILEVYGAARAVPRKDGEESAPEVERKPAGSGRPAGLKRMGHDAGRTKGGS